MRTGRNASSRAATILALLAASAARAATRAPETGWSDSESAIRPEPSPEATLTYRGVRAQFYVEVHETIVVDLAHEPPVE